RPALDVLADVRDGGLGLAPRRAPRRARSSRHRGASGVEADALAAGVREVQIDRRCGRPGAVRSGHLPAEWLRGGPGATYTRDRACAGNFPSVTPIRDWLPPGKRDAVCFTIDDVHPGRSTDHYDAGGDLGKGALGLIAELLERHPQLHVTLFTTADWREI